MATQVRVVQTRLQPFSEIQGTYRGGLSEPTHLWFPYLEGFSSAFVLEALEGIAIPGSRVLDPFAGIGTTPLTIARRGGIGLYCELNPVLGMVTEARGLAFSLQPPDRLRLITEIHEFASKLAHEFLTWPRADDLAESYARCFGNSQYFSSSIRDCLLRVRRGLDDVAKTNQALYPFVHLAALASLVPASLLIRRGDLRFKNPRELSKGRLDYLTEFRRRLGLIAADLGSIPGSSGPVLQVASDAKELPTSPPLDLDAVFTSPPYLNGTNYFRNTKLELWFSRSIGSLADLTSFRRRTVTAGILDVHGSRRAQELPESVEKVVSQVEASAYDRRIPQMVWDYFADISRVFARVAIHLKPKAPVFIDIGDSVYNGVHVPTDRLLADCLSELGMELEDRQVLRRRRSFDGSRLTQVLLRFRRTGDTLKTDTEFRGLRQLPAEWEVYKTLLPHRRNGFNKRNWGNALHSLCSYQGKLKPSIAFHLVRAFAPKGSSIADPFAGVGTIPFEAAMAGVRAWAFEISPPAFYVSWAKLGDVSPTLARATVSRLREYLETQEVDPAELERAGRIRFNGSLPEYFHPATFRQVLLARRYFRLHRPSNASEAFVLACLLHILHGNRPYALSRRSHPLTPFAPSGPAIRKSLVGKLVSKLDVSLRVSRGSSFTPGRVLLQDATRRWPEEVSDLDCIITSPPFYASTRFYMGNWMRLWFAGWEERDFQEKPAAFMDVRQLSSFGAYGPFFQQAHERLKDGGRVVMHLGLSKKSDMAKELAEVCKPYFFVEDLAVESVVGMETHGETGKGGVTAHQYLVLKRED